MSFRFRLCSGSRVGTTYLCAWPEEEGSLVDVIISPCLGYSNREETYAVSLSAMAPVLEGPRSIFPQRDISSRNLSKDGFLLKDDGSFLTTDDSLDTIEAVLKKSVKNTFDALKFCDLGVLNTFYKFLKNVWTDDVGELKGSSLIRTVFSHMSRFQIICDMITSGAPEGFSESRDGATDGVEIEGVLTFACSKGFKNYILQQLEQIPSNFYKMLISSYFSALSEQCSSSLEGDYDFDSFFGHFDIVFPDQSEVSKGKNKFTLGIIGQISPIYEVQVLRNGVRIQDVSVSNNQISFTCEIGKGQNILEVIVFERAPASERHPEFKSDLCTRSSKFKETYQG